MPLARAQEKPVEVLQECFASPFFVGQSFSLRPPDLPLGGIFVEPVKELLELKIEIDEKTKTCSGEVSIRLIPLRPQFDTVRLGAAQMSISEVRLGTSRLEHHLTVETLFVALGKAYGMRDTLNLTVACPATGDRLTLQEAVCESPPSRVSCGILSAGRQFETPLAR